MTDGRRCSQCGHVNEGSGASMCSTCGCSLGTEQEVIEELPEGAAMSWQEMLKEGQAAFIDVPEEQLDHDLAQITARVKGKLSAKRSGQTQLPA